MAWPAVARLALRLALAAVLVLWLSQQFGAALVRPLLPFLAATVERLDPRFVVEQLTVQRAADGERVLLVANLAAPLRVGLELLQPFGSGGTPAGGIRVSFTLGGVWQYVDLLLIGVLAWPARSAGSLLRRLPPALGLCVLLWLLQLPATLAAELWHALAQTVHPQPIEPLLVWSRFVMGGGGAALALLAAALAIATGERLRHTSVTSPGDGRAGH